MTLQEYYELQGKLKMLDAAMATIDATVEEVRDTFNKIDPTQLSTSPLTPTGIAQQTTALPPTIPQQTTAVNPVPVAAPKQRTRLNTPVLTGPLKDAVEDILTEKAEAAAAAAAPKRLAPYEVVVKDVQYNGASGDYWASVHDQKHSEEAMVPVSKGTYDEFTRDPDGLVIDLNGYVLEKTEWFPVQEPNKTAVEVATEA